MSGITRVNKQSDFVSIDNAVLNNEELSWEARGVLAYLLSKPNGWQCRNGDIIKQGPAGRNKVTRIIAELRSARYVYRYQIHSKGRWSTITEVYESPDLNPHKGPTSGKLPILTDGETDEIQVPENRSPVTGILKPVSIVNTEKERTERVKRNAANAATAPPKPQPGLEMKIPDDLGNSGSAATAAAEKPPTFRSVFQTQLREAFCEWTELADPPMVSAGDKRLYGKRWRQPLREMFLECGGDEEQTLAILESTCRYMIAEELTFDSPASMLRTFKSIRAKAIRKANGSGLVSKVEPFKWTSDSALWQQVIDDLARKKGATVKQVLAVRASLRTVGSSSEILAANEFVSARQMEAFIGELRRQLER